MSLSATGLDRLSWLKLGAPAMCMWLKFGVPGLLAMVLGPASSRAQSDEAIFRADRPRFGESPWAIHPGEVAVETGVSFFTGDNDALTVRLPEALLRVGLPFGFEARLGAPSAILIVEDGLDPTFGNGLDGETSFAPLSLGTKYALPRWDVLSASTILVVELPVEDDPRGWEPEVALSLNVEVEALTWFSVGGSGFVRWARGRPVWGMAGLLNIEIDDVRPFLQASFVRAEGLEAELAQPTSTLGADRSRPSSELLSSSPFSNEAAPAIEVPALAIGLTYLATPRVQLDFRLGWEWQNIEVRPEGENPSAAVSPLFDSPTSGPWLNFTVGGAYLF